MRKTILLAAALAFLLFWNVSLWREIGERKSTEVHFFDVEQGDAILIQTPQGHDILIDGGPDKGILEKLGEELPLWNRDIELLMLTHADADHITGQVHALEGYAVERVLWSGFEADTPVFKRWEELVGDREIFRAAAGRRIRAGDASFTVLHPEAGREIETPNEASLVTKGEFSGVTFLFTGDIPSAVERELADRADVSADVLKVAHHGSKSSTSAKLLLEAKPQIAVVSAGKENPYGHPAPEVIARLQNYGIQIVRTDKEGDILFRISR